MTCCVCTTVCRWKRFDNWWTVNWAMPLEPLCVLKGQRSAKFTYYVHNCYPLQISRHCRICCEDLSCPSLLPSLPSSFSLSSPSLLPHLSSPSAPSSLLSPLLFSSFLLSLLSISPLSPSSPSSQPLLFLRPLPPPPMPHFLALKAGTVLVTTSVSPCTSTYIIMEVFPVFPCSSNFVQTSTTT